MNPVLLMNINPQKMNTSPSRHDPEMSIVMSSICQQSSDAKKHVEQDQQHGQHEGDMEDSSLESMPESNIQSKELCKVSKQDTFLILFCSKYLRDPMSIREHQYSHVKSV